MADEDTKFQWIQQCRTHIFFLFRKKLAQLRTIVKKYYIASTAGLLQKYTVLYSDRINQTQSKNKKKNYRFLNLFIWRFHDQFFASSLIIIIAEFSHSFFSREKKTTHTDPAQRHCAPAVTHFKITWKNERLFLSFVRFNQNKWKLPKIMHLMKGKNKTYQHNYIEWKETYLLPYILVVFFCVFLKDFSC